MLRRASSMLVEQGKILPQRLGEFGLLSEEQAIL
jgi:hypothetical protein